MTSADKRRERIYKITPEQHKQDLINQDNCCAICRKKITKAGAVPILNRDHDHKCCPRRLKEYCGKCNRGLLCFVCNKYLNGVLERSYEDAEVIAERLWKYLQYWNQVLKERGAYGPKPEPKAKSKQSRLRKSKKSV